MPLRIARAASARGRRSAEIAVARLGLAPGDSLVYRVVGRDRRPGEAGLASSDTFFIEVAGPGSGRARGIRDAAGPRAVRAEPADDRPEARAAARPRADARSRDARTGGGDPRGRAARGTRELHLPDRRHVEDEEEEAEHSHEIQEGRLREHRPAARSRSRSSTWAAPSRGSRPSTPAPRCRPRARPSTRCSAPSAETATSCGACRCAAASIPRGGCPGDLSDGVELAARAVAGRADDAPAKRARVLLAAARARRRRSARHAADGGVDGARRAGARDRSRLRSVAGRGKAILGSRRYPAAARPLGAAAAWIGAGGAIAGLVQRDAAGPVEPGTRRRTRSAAPGRTRGSANERSEPLRAAAVVLWHCRRDRSRWRVDAHVPRPVDLRLEPRTTDAAIAPAEVARTHRPDHADRRHVREQRGAGRPRCRRRRQPSDGRPVFRPRSSGSHGSLRIGRAIERRGAARGDAGWRTTVVRGGSRRGRRRPTSSRRSRAERRRAGAQSSTSGPEPTNARASRSRTCRRRTVAAFCRCASRRIGGGHAATTRRLAGCRARAAPTRARPRAAAVVGRGVRAARARGESGVRRVGVRGRVEGARGQRRDALRARLIVSWTSSKPSSSARRKS